MRRCAAPLAPSDPMNLNEPGTGSRNMHGGRVMCAVCKTRNAVTIWGLS